MVQFTIVVGKRMKLSCSLQMSEQMQSLIFPLLIWTVNTWLKFDRWYPFWIPMDGGLKLLPCSQPTLKLREAEAWCLFYMVINQTSPFFSFFFFFFPPPFLLRVLTFPNSGNNDVDDIKSVLWKYIEEFCGGRSLFLKSFFCESS